MAELAARIVEVKDAPEDAGLGRREHEARIRRLRYVLGIGLALWNAIGIPNDRAVTELFGLSYAEFTDARVVVTTLQLLGWGALFLRLSPRGLRVAETTVFVSTSAGLALLNHGIAGPTPMFLSCTMLAQGAAIPRPWREGIRTIGATLLAYPLGMIGLELVTGRNTAEWASPELVATFVHTLSLALVTFAVVVLGGDALHGLRRNALAAQRVGRYRLKERLGGGAGGEVWRARHPGLGEDVALKLARVGGERRVEDEAAILAQLEHPTTVRLVDRGRTEDGRPFYAMELVRGRTLAAEVAEHGPLVPERVVVLGRALARALAEVHGRGVVHADVTPENVLLADAGAAGDVPRLVDFGLAARVGSPAGAGSPRFLSPEARAGAVLDPRRDVFALGALLYFARTGKSPLGGDEAPTRALEASIASLDTMEEPLRGALRACLAASDERPVDGSAVLAALVG